MTVGELRIERAALDSDVAAPLLAGLNAESQARYDFDLSKHFQVDAGDVQGERGVFLLAFLGHEAVGCGAVRLLSGGDAELKRMYVAPWARRRGIARALLHRLEEEARRLGGSRLILETGNKQVEALAFYRGEGFRDIPRYEPYVNAAHSICLAKPLVV